MSKSVVRKEMCKARAILVRLTFFVMLLPALTDVAISHCISLAPTAKPPSSMQTSLDAGSLALQRERLELDKQKFAVETETQQQRLRIDQAKLDQDQTNARRTALLSLAPLLAAIGTLLYSIWSFRKQIELQTKLQNEASQSQFQMKAAEIAFAGAKTPEAVQNRANALKALFEDRLPHNFATMFDASQVGGAKEVPEAKQFFLELLLKYPNLSVATTELWKALFQEDWLDRVKPLLHLLEEKKIQ